MPAPSAIIELTRILGNAIPFRDLPNGRLDALRWILRKEPALPGCRANTWWLNRIISYEEQTAYWEALSRHNRVVRHRPIEAAAMATLGAEDRLAHLTDINGARNDVIAAGTAPYVAAFDSETFFSIHGYHALLCGILEAGWAGRMPDFYAVPMYRLADERQAEQALAATSPIGEPQEVQLMVRRGLRPYAARPYGKRDKVELLVRLGFPVESCQHTGPVDNDLVATAGWVYHYPSGDPACESGYQVRDQMRRQGLQELLRRWDEL